MIDTEERPDVPQPLVELLVVPRRRHRAQHGADPAPERLEAKPLGEPRLGLATVAPLDEQRADEAGLEGDQAERGRGVPAILLPQRRLRVEHLAAAGQPPLVESPARQLAAVEA